MNCAVAEGDYSMFDLTQFDEDILIEHQMKVMIIFGCLFGFRGNKEYVNLKRCNIVTGIYPDNHASFPGWTWWGLDGLSDKTLKLSLKNPYVRDQGELLKYPVVPNHPDKDIGGCIARLATKLDECLVTKGTHLNARVFRTVGSTRLGLALLAPLKERTESDKTSRLRLKD